MVRKLDGVSVVEINDSSALLANINKPNCVTHALLFLLLLFLLFFCCCCSYRWVTVCPCSFVLVVFLFSLFMLLFVGVLLFLLLMLLLCLSLLLLFLFLFVVVSPPRYGNEVDGLGYLGVITGPLCGLSGLSCPSHPFPSLSLPLPAFPPSLPTYLFPPSLPSYPFPLPIYFCLLFISVDFHFLLFPHSFPSLSFSLPSSPPTLFPNLSSHRFSSCPPFYSMFSSPLLPFTLLLFPPLLSHSILA